MADLDNQLIGRTREEFLTLYTNVVEPFRSKGKCYRLLYNRIDPVILAFNDISGLFRIKGDCYKLLLNDIDRLTLSDIMEPFIRKFVYYRLLLCGADLALLDSDNVVEPLVSRGERYNLLRKRARSLKVAFDDGVEPLTLLDIFIPEPTLRDYLKLLRKRPITNKTKYKKLRSSKKKGQLVISNRLYKMPLLPALQYDLWKSYIS